LPVRAGDNGASRRRRPRNTAGAISLDGGGNPASILAHPCEPPAKRDSPGDPRPRVYKQLPLDLPVMPPTMANPGFGPRKRAKYPGPNNGLRAKGRISHEGVD
jgi:hypothetical protein